MALLEPEEEVKENGSVPPPVCHTLYTIRFWFCSKHIIKSGPKSEVFFQFSFSFFSFFLLFFLFFLLFFFLISRPTVGPTTHFQLTLSPFLCPSFAGHLLGPAAAGPFRAQRRKLPRRSRHLAGPGLGPPRHPARRPCPFPYHAAWSPSWSA